MLITEFIQYLKQNIFNTEFYNSMIDKNNKCVGVYTRSGLKPYLALGGLSNTTYNYKRFDLLVHWGQDATECEIKANEIYNELFGKSNFYVGNCKVIQIEMLDSNPIDLSRDVNNNCEMIIRVIIYYEREVKI